MSIELQHYNIDNKNLQPAGGPVETISLRVREVLSSSPYMVEIYCLAL